MTNTIDFITELFFNVDNIDDNKHSQAKLYPSEIAQWDREYPVWSGRLFLSPRSWLTTLELSSISSVIIISKEHYLFSTIIFMYYSIYLLTKLKSCR